MTVKKFQFWFGIVLVLYFVFVTVSGVNDGKFRTGLPLFSAILLGFLGVLFIVQGLMNQRKDKS